MDWLPVVRFFHLVAASVWTGGLLVLGFLVMALRRAGAERPLLQAAARQFARVSWVAMAVAIGTGIAQVELLAYRWSYGRLHMKLGLVALAVLIALGHQLTAKKSSPAVRGIVQLVIMLVSLGIFAAAISLRGG